MQRLLCPELHKSVNFPLLPILSVLAVTQYSCSHKPNPSYTTSSLHQHKKDNIKVEGFKMLA